MIELKDKKILSQNGESSGKATGATYHCTHDNCDGLLVSTQWEDGKTTFPCSNELKVNPDGSIQIR